jgi:hypothetical protein
MAFHYSRFGIFGLALRNYADLHGYVPQAGDEPEDFVWSHADFEREDDGADPEAWLDHVADAIAATERAQVNLTIWQNS